MREVPVFDIIFSAYNTAFGLLCLREVKHSALNYLYSIRVVEYMVVHLYCVFGIFCEFKILRNKYRTLFPTNINDLSLYITVIQSY